MYKLVVLACVLAASQAAIVAPYAGWGYGAGLGYAGLPHAGLGYAGLGYAGLGYAGLGHAGLPLGYAHSALPLAAPVAAPAVVAPAPVNYALPAARTIQEAPIVETAVEPVEQHGYKIRY